MDWSLFPVNIPSWAGRRSRFSLDVLRIWDSHIPGLGEARVQNRGTLWDGEILNSHPVLCFIARKIVPSPGIPRQSQTLPGCCSAEVPPRCHQVPPGCCWQGRCPGTPEGPFPALCCHCCHTVCVPVSVCPVSVSLSSTDVPVVSPPCVTGQCWLCPQQHGQSLSSWRLWGGRFLQGILGEELG